MSMQEHVEQTIGIPWQKWVTMSIHERVAAEKAYMDDQRIQELTARLLELEAGAFRWNVGTQSHDWIGTTEAWAEREEVRRQLAELGA